MLLISHSSKLFLMEILKVQLFMWYSSPGGNVAGTNLYTMNMTVNVLNDHCHRILMNVTVNKL